jgi:hypothetical protein
MFLRNPKNLNVDFLEYKKQMSATQPQLGDIKVHLHYVGTGLITNGSSGSGIKQRELLAQFFT